MEKTSKIIAVLAVLIAGSMIASAGLLTYYGKVTTTANVSQSILVDGKDYNNPITDSFATTGGCTVCKPHWIKNNAPIEATVGFDTTYWPDGEGITTSYWKLDEPTESVAGEVNDVTPSTNEQNKINDWSHVDISYDDVNAGEVKLTFVQPRYFVACFEYRTDGDTSQMIDPNNYNTDITDGLYPYVCLDNRGNTVTMTETITLSADDYVEVRMVFGGERDERFDWTRFDVLGTKILEGQSFTLGAGETLDIQIYHIFDIAIIPDTYTITTSIVPN